MQDIMLYLHIPFCRSKCAYCDFYSLPRAESLFAPYADALVGQIRRAAGGAEAADARVTSVYVGGGTPTALPTELLTRVLDEALSRFRVARDAEVTVEANPDSARPETLRALRRTGANRLSLGVQAAQDDLLRALGRPHDFAQAREAAFAARDAGFDNLNADVMYGLPEQTLSDYLETLRQVTALPVTHVSAYSLILEEETPLWTRVRRGECALPDDDAVADMTDAGARLLAEAGFAQYEVSNYAKPGRACRHNLGYWHGTPYIGLGAAAHGMTRARGEIAAAEAASAAAEAASAATEAASAAAEAASAAAEAPSPRGTAPRPFCLRYATPANVSDYIARAREGRDPRGTFTLVSAKEARFEALMLGLRTRDGVSEDAFRAAFGTTVREAFGARVAFLIAQGLLEEHAGCLRCTPRGLAVENAVLVALMD